MLTAPIAIENGLHQDLLAAFEGESNAHAKYQAAHQADAEGLHQRLTCSRCCPRRADPPTSCSLIRSLERGPATITQSRKVHVRQLNRARRGEVSAG
jgi:hypothetical protein